MIQEIKTLTQLELCNLFHKNVYKYTKDKKQKQRQNAMILAYLILLVIVIGYVSGLCYGLIHLKLDHIVISYICVLASILILIFNVFTVGHSLLSYKGYELLCALPISSKSIVISRFTRIYVENLLLSLVILLPGLCIYSVFLQPPFYFYIYALILIWFIGCIPLCISIAISFVIKVLSSYVKHKSILETCFAILLVMGIMLFSFQAQVLEENITMDVLTNFALQMEDTLHTLYPFAHFIQKALLYNDVFSAIRFIVISIVCMLITITVVSYKYHVLLQRMKQTHTTKNKNASAKQDTLVFALYKKECKRYFASSMYVTNTIIGPILALVFALSFLVMDVDTIQASIPFLNIKEILPYLFVSILTMMPPISVSLSMEGKQYWILKSLPISTEDILHSKLLFNLSLLFPFYMVSEITFLFILDFTLLDALWMIVLPAIITMFVLVWSLYIDIKFCNYDWEKEEVIVKQSINSLLGGFSSLLIGIICIGITTIIPTSYDLLFKVILTLILSIATVILYKHIKQIPFHKIG